MSEKYPDYDYDPRNLPDEFLQAIGLAIASSAHTENIVRSTIAGLLGVDEEVGWALTAHMTSQQRDGIARSLIEFRTSDGDILNEFDRLMNDVDSASSKRGIIAHHLWCKNKATGEIYSFKTTARSGLTVNFEPVNSEKIEADALFIYNAGIGVFEFLRNHNLLSELPPIDRARDHMNRAARSKRRKRSTRS